MTILPSIIICKLILACSMSKGETSLENGMNISTTCSEGTFYSKEYLRCIPCSWCDSYSVKLSSCTATSDTVCLRCADTSNPDIANHPSCKKCPPCNPGEYISKPCTDDSITVCLPCPSESFNIQPSYKTHCIPCTSCENRIMVKDCNASMDTICGSCKRGYYKDPNRNTCYRCSRCLPGGKVIEECKGGRPGKLCSAFHFYRVDYVEVSNVTESTTLVHTTSSYLNISSVPAHDISVLTTSSRVLILITSACFFILIVCVTALAFCCLRRRRQKTEHLLNDQEVDEFLLETDCGDRYENTNCQSVAETKINISSKDNYTDSTKNELMESCYNNYDVENNNAPAVMRDQRHLYSYDAAMTESIHANKTHPQRNLWQNVFF